MNVYLPRIAIALIAGWVLWLAGCSGHAVPLQPLREDAVVLAFGDSLTFGTGAAREQSYPAVLSALIDRQVVNAGVPGELSSAGVRRLPSLLAKHRPGLVVLCHGGNDILRRRDRAALRTNLEQMIVESRAAGAEVVLLAVPDFGLMLSAAEDYRAVAAATGVPLEDQALPEILADRGLKSDAIHPDAGGYQRLAEAVVALLKRHGAL